MKEKLIRSILASILLGVGASWAVDMDRTNGPTDALMVAFLVGVGAMVAQCNILWAIDETTDCDDDDSPQPDEERGER